MRIVVRYVLLIYLTFYIHQSYSQDVQFSQLYVDRTWLNPAYAGIDYCPRISLLHRNQWPGIQFPYTTYNFTFEKYVDPLQGGIGFRLMKDEQGSGVFSQLSASLIYAYEAKISRKSSLRFAMEASIYQRSENLRDLVFYNMIDPAQGISYPNQENILPEKFFSPDFSFGIMFRHSAYFGGISASHIPMNLVPEHNIYLPLKIVVHAGAAIPLDKKDKKKDILVLEPNIVYIKQQKHHMLFYGMYFDIKQISAGIFLRHDQSFKFTALILSNYLNYKDLRIGYSIDLSLSGLIGHTWGTHEISILYNFSCVKKIKNYNTISCPSF